MWFYLDFFFFFYSNLFIGTLKNKNKENIDILIFLLNFGPLKCENRVEMKISILSYKNTSIHGYYNFFFNIIYSCWHMEKENFKILIFISKFWGLWKAKKWS